MSEGAERNPLPRDESPERRPGSLPTRLLGGGARAAGRVAAATGVNEAVEVATEEAIVRAVESETVERALARVLEGPALEQAVARALESPAVERAVLRALDSEMVDHLWERLLSSDEAQKLVERIAEAPEVRSAIAAQGAGFIQDIGREAGEILRGVDDVVERIVRTILFRRRREGETNCAGAVSRLLAVLIDAALLNAAFFAASSIVGIFTSAVIGDSDGTSTSLLVAGTGLWLLLGGLYLTAFWSLAGQTPGMRFLGIKLDAGGESKIGLRRSVRRLVGIFLALIPLGLGFLGILTSERRRGWQDRLAGTEVRYVSLPEPTAPWSEAPAERAST